MQIFQEKSELIVKKPKTKKKAKSTGKWIYSFNETFSQASLI